MRIAFNPSTVAALTTPPNNKDITFDLRGQNIFARGVKFYGTDTNTWRDIKIDGVSIGSHTLDLRNGSNTTLTNKNGIVTINSTWRPVVDNLTSDSTTSSLSAKQGKVLAGLIKSLDTNISNQYALRNGSNATGRWRGGLACLDVRNTNYTPHDLNSGLELLFLNNNTNNLKDGGAYNGVFSFRQWSSGSDWSGGKAHQLSFTDNGNIWHRTSSGDDFWETWKKLAYYTDIPSSLKNPHALTISLNGTSQGPYDGSAAKSINITAASVGAATSDHNHDGRYVYNYGGTADVNGQALNQNALFMSTTSGISGEWWHILQAAWNGEYRWNSQIAFPTQDRNGMYYRSGLDNNTKWGAWVKLLDTNNYSSVLDIRYITDIATSTNKLTFTRNGSNIDRSVTVNVVQSLGRRSPLTERNAISGIYTYGTYSNEDNLAPTTCFETLGFGEGTAGTIEIGGSWISSGQLYWRALRDVSDNWFSWKTILDSSNYAGILDSRYYTESEVNSLLSTKLDRVNLSTGGWNPRGYNLAADYSYNGGDLSISESGGQIHVSVDGYFWQNEGQYRVLDTSDVAGIRGSISIQQYLSNTDTNWYPIIWGGDDHRNTYTSTGAVYKSHDVLSWQTSSQTLYATRLATNSIDLQSNRGIFQVTSGGTSPYKGISLPDLQSNGLGMFSKIGEGNGADEGGIIISADTSVIYNSFDTGWGLTIRDKDRGQMDISGEGTIAFGVRQDYKAYSLGGFEKSGSNNSYVLLGGGDHKLESALRVAYATNADKLDGYHENSFLRYRGATNTDQEATLWDQIGIKSYGDALPDGLTNIYNYGSVISLPGSGSRFEIYASHLSSAGNGLYYRSGWNNDKRPWLKFIDSSNIGSQSVNYANSAGNADTVDGYHATDGRTFNGAINWGSWGDDWSDGTNKHPWYGFDHRYPNTGAYSTTITDYFGMTIKTANTLRLDFSNLLLNGTSIYDINVASATKVIVNQHTSNDTNYPLVWSNQPNTSNVTENQLFKSWEDLYYNPKNKILAVGGYFMGPWARFTDQNGALVIGDNSSARISAIGDQIIFNTGSSLRFGETAWDWNQWAGLKYKHSAKTIYLGIADDSVFNARSAQSNGTLKFPGISNIDLDNGAQIRREGSSQAWVTGRSGALLRETSVAGYHTLWSLKTTDGSWDFGEYNAGSGWNNVPILSYVTDSNYASGNNTTTYQIRFPLDSGTVALTKNIPSSLPANGGNADTLDGVHLNGIFTAFGNNAHNITATIGGVTKSFLVNYAADADKVDGVHITWAGALTSTSHLVAWEADGSALRDINPANVTVGSANYASNADTVDGYHASQLAKAWSGSGTMNQVAQNNGNYFGMITGTGTGGFPNDDGGQTHVFQSSYNNNSGGDGNTGNFWITQIANRAGTTSPWIRSRAGGSDITTGWTDWVRIMTKNDVDNYYWANIKVSTSSNTQTTPTFNTAYATNWFRARGNSGFYFQDHAGGWYMSDNDWIRTWGSKALYVNNTIRSTNYQAMYGSTSVSAAKLESASSLVYGTDTSSNSINTYLRGTNVTLQVKKGASTNYNALQLTSDRINCNNYCDMKYGAAVSGGNLTVQNNAYLAQKTGTKVGIGTGSPQATLDVQSNELAPLRVGGTIQLAINQNIYCYQPICVAIGYIVSLSDRYETYCNVKVQQQVTKGNVCSLKVEFPDIPSTLKAPDSYMIFVTHHNPLDYPEKFRVQPTSVNYKLSFTVSHAAGERFYMDFIIYRYRNGLTKYPVLI